MEVGRAVFGLATIELLDALLSLTVVGTQVQVNRQAPAAFFHRRGQLRGEAGVQLLLQRLGRRTKRDQRIAHRLNAWCIA
jgi:hypothetical protein